MTPASVSKTAPEKSVEMTDVVVCVAHVQVVLCVGARANVNANMPARLVNLLALVVGVLSVVNPTLMVVVF
tara:strand:+ start:5842 stop:6054 length:213 start_codon:yes stop_codon:yes gene_type:complete